MPSEDYEQNLYRSLLIEAGIDDETIEQALVGDRAFLRARVAGALEGKGLKMGYGDSVQASVPPEELKEYQKQGYRWIGTNAKGEEVVEYYGKEVEKEIRAKTKMGSEQRSSRRAKH
jgi:hypothetical protein